MKLLETKIKILSIYSISTILLFRYLICDLYPFQKLYILHTKWSNVFSLPHFMTYFHLNISCFTAMLFHYLFLWLIVVPDISFFAITVFRYIFSWLIFVPDISCLPLRTENRKLPENVTDLCYINKYSFGICTSLVIILNCAEEKVVTDGCRLMHTDSYTYKCKIHHV